MIATFGTETTKSTILSACRGYRSEDYPDGIDVDIAQYLSSLIEQERGFLFTLSDTIYGNEEKGRKPNQTFIREIEKFPGLLDIMFGIEGLINKRSSHASGVIMFDEDPYASGCFMRTPSGDIITQFDLHMCEAVGMTKFDFLVTDIQDKICKTIDLLQKDNVIDSSLSLREAYEEFLHPDVLPIDSPKIWKALSEGTVLNVFQFDSTVGSQAARKIKPKTILEMSDANSLMRLMASEKGAETPMDKYIRFKENINLWYDEMRYAGLTQKEQKTLEPYFLQSYGVPPSQEQLMLMLMDKDICGFTLKEANDARKIVGKKQMNKIPELHEKILKQAKTSALGQYVWKCGVGPQLGYSFSLIHALAYSFIGVQSLFLATHFNPIYWNTACLIVNSGSLNEDKNDSTNYAKLAQAIGETRSAGINVGLADINSSSFSFVPDATNNKILFGLKAMDKIGTEVVNEIIENRPYNNFSDFIMKTNLKKPAIISLIKGGAFDFLGDRKKVMGLFIWLTCDKKSRITLQNFNGLMQRELIPEQFAFEKSVFEFNRYLKAICKSGVNYVFNERALSFYQQYFNPNTLFYENGNTFISQKDWDKIYKSAMDPVRDWMKANQQEILQTLNYQIFKEDWDKYAKGSISKWEMESLCFYYHDHELKNLNAEKYGLEEFFDLSEEPDVERYFPDKNKIMRPIYKIHSIAGTCIAKDKPKSTVYLLTNKGVCAVKFRKEYFALFDRQISQIQPDGSKKVMEKSWFNRGSMIVVKGIRRGDSFIVKKYNNTDGHQLYKINSIDEYGNIVITHDRAKGDLGEDD